MTTPNRPLNPIVPTLPEGDRRPTLHPPQPRPRRRSSPAGARSSNSLPAIFTVDPRSGVPLYLQLIEQVKRAIALGALLPGRAVADGQSARARADRQPEHGRARLSRTRARRRDRHEPRARLVRAQPTAAPSKRGARWPTSRSRAFDGAVREAKSLGLSRDETHELMARTIARWYGTENDR